MTKLTRYLLTAFGVADSIAFAYALIESLVTEELGTFGPLTIPSSLLHGAYAFLIVFGIGLVIAVNWDWINQWRTRKARAEAELKRKIEHAYVRIRNCYEIGLIDLRNPEALEARDYINPLRKELELAQLDPPQLCTVSDESFRVWYLYLSNLRLR